MTHSNDIFHQTSVLSSELGLQAWSRSGSLRAELPMSTSGPPGNDSEGASIGYGMRSGGGWEIITRVRSEGSLWDLQ